MIGNARDGQHTDQTFEDERCGEVWKRCASKTGARGGIKTAARAQPSSGEVPGEKPLSFRQDGEKQKEEGSLLFQLPPSRRGASRARTQGAKGAAVVRSRRALEAGGPRVHETAEREWSHTPRSTWSCRLGETNDRCDFSLQQQ